jgi:[protein-PII] uridylyltransferase
VQTLLDSIEADAEKRLTLPPGTHPAQEVARYRRFLRFETQRLRMLHRNGAGGRAICRARAGVVDALLRRTMEDLQAGAAAAAEEACRTCALVAIGGYGRGELNPCSDLDVMLLLEGENRARKAPPAPLELFTGGLIFDIGLKVGHSVRTVADCVEVANRDMQSKTSLIEARLICGDAKLFAGMQQAVLARCVRRHEDEYIAARLADQAARRTQYGNSAAMQEPNIKNGCGGLRDFQNLLWMAFFKYQSRTLADLRKEALISEEEEAQLEAGYDFLLRVRNELHYLTERPVDVLTRNYQPAVAYHLGYTDRSLAVRQEKFMRDYYTHSRRIYLITRTLEQRLALLPQPHRLPTLRHFLRERRRNAAYAVDGFKFVDGQVHAEAERVFREDPRRLMRVFRYAQQRHLTLSPDIVQRLRHRGELLDENFRRDPHVRDTFLEILNQRGEVAPALRAMHEVGLLGRYLPPFEKLTNRVQHEFFHQYAVDEHVLVCLEKLDQIQGATERPFAAYAPLFQEVERPFILYLAMLLHDTGKATGSRHHAADGGRIALSVARRLDLDPAATETLHFLVQHHLAMVQVSQRRNLDDPGEIRRFATLVQTLERLNLLTLLTFADSMGTSDQLWTGHKEALLWLLHHRTHEYLAGRGQPLQVDARQREALKEEIRAEALQTVSDDELTAHFAALPARYYQLRTGPEILADLALTHRFMVQLSAEQAAALAPVVEWVHDADRGYSRLRLCTWDRTGLFSKIAGALTAARLNILSAEVFTRSDGIVLDTFLVTDAATSSPATERQQQLFSQYLDEGLQDEEALARVIFQQKPVALPRLSEGERLPTEVAFDNAASELGTVLEIEAEDRFGLLFAIVRTLAELDVDIVVAKICTEKGAAMDTFYVRELRHPKIESAARQKQIAARLKAAIKKLA